MQKLSVLTCSPRPTLTHIHLAPRLGLMGQMGLWWVLYLGPQSPQLWLGTTVLGQTQ